MKKISCMSIVLLSFLIIANNTYAETETWAAINGYGVSKNQNLVDVSIQAGGTIPTDGSLGAIGYGVITGSNDDGHPENVLALTSHKCVADSLVQGPTDDCDNNTVGLVECAI